VRDLAAERPQYPVHPAGGVSCSVTERQARRRAARLERLAQLQKARKVFRHLVVAGGGEHALATNERTPARSGRHRDPASLVHAEIAADAVPAPGFLSEEV